MTNLFGLRRQTLYILLNAALLPGVVAAQEVEDGRRVESRKPAWKWTLDERLAARFDPLAMAAREAEYEAKRKSRFKHVRGGFFVERTEVTDPPSVSETIDGSKNPELFLPGELFDMLLHHAFPPGKERPNPQESENGFAEWAAALGFGPDFQDRLEWAVAPYLKLLQSELPQGGTTGANAPKWEQETRLRLCPARVQALEAAEAELGEEAFLRLLYEGVAPSVRHGAVFSSLQRRVEELRFQEGGCR